MQILSHPASTGAAWLRDGWRLLRRQPIGLPAMVVIYLFMLLVPAMFPVIGVAVAGVLSPFATVGLMTACRDAAGGRSPNPAAFAQAFQDATRRMLLFRLGVIHAALLLLVSAAATLLTGGQPEPPDPAPVSLEDLPLREMLIQLLLFSPVIVAMWFAPLLAGWHGLGPAKAMFGSAVACWRNRAAMLVYGALMIAVLLGVSLMAVSLLGALVSSRQLLSILLAPVGLALMTLIQASFYPMYRSIFTEGGG
jgi:hypothetical protein